MLAEGMQMQSLLLDTVLDATVLTVSRNTIMPKLEMTARRQWHYWLYITFCVYANAHLVICRLAPPKVIIVHRWEVVMYQGHCVDHLHSTGCRHSLLDGASNQLTSC